MKNKPIQGGYTLVELIIAVGLFALIMTLSSGAYLVMIGLNRQVQNISTGINNLSFALESMVRDIRTGSVYNCGGIGDCSGGTTFSFKDSNGRVISYSLSGSALQRTIDGATQILTDSSVTIDSLNFYAYGTRKPPGDYVQARVTVIVRGTVSAGAGKPAQSFTVETGATMRGSDI